MRTYSGHRQAIRGIDFNNSGDNFLSTSYDRYIKLWDTETGECVNRFTNNKVRKSSSPQIVRIFIAFFLFQKLN